MVGIFGYYIIFLIIGIVCGNLAPSYTAVTGWNSVGHYYEEEQVTNFSEQLAFVAIPILIIASIILVSKTKKDIKKGKVKEDEERNFIEQYYDESVGTLVLKYVRYEDKSVNYSGGIILGVILWIIGIVLSIIGIGVPIIVIGFLIGVPSFVITKLCEIKVKQIEKELELKNVDIEELKEKITAKRIKENKNTN